LRITNYIKVNSIDEAYNKLITSEKNVVLGGGAFLKLSPREYDTAIDLNDLGLDYIKDYEDCVEIGSMTTLREVETNMTLQKCFNGILSKAASVIMGVQLRNVATVGGTVWGRYGFSDFITALIALETKVCLYKLGEVSLDEFISSSNNDKDIILCLKINKNITAAAFKDFRTTATDFAILNVAASRVNNHYKIAVGARPGVAIVACKTMDLINALENPIEKLPEIINTLSNEVHFGNDLRASSEYRNDIAKVLLKRCLMEVF